MLNDPERDVYPPHVQRIAVELQELVERMDKLHDFTQTSEFYGLSYMDQRLLKDQCKEMKAYAKTLSLRYTKAQLKYGWCACKIKPETGTTASPGSRFSDLHDTPMRIKTSSTVPGEGVFF